VIDRTEVHDHRSPAGGVVQYGLLLGPEPLPRVAGPDAQDAEPLPRARRSGRRPSRRPAVRCGSRRGCRRPGRPRRTATEQRAVHGPLDALADAGEQQGEHGDGDDAEPLGRDVPEQLDDGEVGQDDDPEGRRT
jgi:hypothetical protein